MEVEFRNKELLRLYETGKSRKYRLNRQVLRKFFMRVQQLEAAENMYDLWKTPSLKFERLKRTESRFSVRVDAAYRLEIEMHWQDDKKTKGKVLILEMSKHYKG